MGLRTVLIREERPRRRIDVWGTRLTEKASFLQGLKPNLKSAVTWGL
jgi:hypothetical protein